MTTASLSATPAAPTRRRRRRPRRTARQVTTDPTRRPDRRTLVLQDVARQLDRLHPRPDWQVQRPSRVNQPAYFVSPQGRVRVLYRSLDARSGRYRFTLRHQGQTPGTVYALICRDQAQGCHHVVMVPSTAGTVYLSLTPDDVRAQASAVLPLAG